MSWAHIHLAVNHVPVILLPVGLALLAVAMSRKSVELTKAGLLTFVLAAAIAGGVYLTGEPTEKAVEGFPSVSSPTIEVHEEAALLALVTATTAGLFALGTLFASRRRSHPNRWMLAATVTVALVATGLMARTANLGGQISHPEIRGQDLPVAPPIPVHEE